MGCDRFRNDIHRSICRDANLWRSEIWRFFFFSTPKKDRVRASNVYLNLTPGKLKEDFRVLPKTYEVDPTMSDIYRRLPMISDVDPKTIGVEHKSSEDYRLCESCNLTRLFASEVGNSRENGAIMS